MISEEVKRAYREIMHDYRQYGPEVHLVNYALRDTLAELLYKRQGGKRTWDELSQSAQAFWKNKAQEHLRGES